MLRASLPWSCRYSSRRCGDDNEETIRKRFAVYHSQTEPLSKWFEAEGIRHTFDWSICKTKEGMLEAIFQEIERQNK
ncbi:MAG: hypothetical protein K6C30_01335 [Bacteroidaceae bacterium]|nr:hypothetical protein [Bacteroidaceae bacterium]